MAKTITREGDPEEWGRLMSMLTKKGDEGYVVVGGVQYKVLRPGDGEIKFVQMGGFDEMYGSVTR